MKQLQFGKAARLAALGLACSAFALMAGCSANNDNSGTGGGNNGNGIITSFTASPTSLISGGTTTLTWTTVTGTDSCAASGGDTQDNDGWNGTAIPVNGTLKTNPLTTNGTYSYTLTCTKGGTTGSISLPVTVGTTAAPTVNIEAVPPTVASGTGSTVSWTTTNAVTCKSVANTDPKWVVPASGSSVSTSGSITTTPQTNNGTGPQSIDYTLNCTGSTNSGMQSGSGTASVTTNAAATPPPTFASFLADPTSVPLNGTSKLVWATKNASKCTASVAPGGNADTTWPTTINNNGQDNVAGTFTTAPLATNGNYGYTLTCVGDGGQVSKTVTVTAGAVGQPSVSLTLQSGKGITTTSTVGNTTNYALDRSTGVDNATLTWTSTNVDSCTASGSWSGDRPTIGTASTGSLITNSTYSYTLTCSGGGGSATSTAILAVSGTPPVGPTSCGVTLGGNVATALINRTTAQNTSPQKTFSTDMATTNGCGLLGVCGVTNPDNVVDPDVTDFAVLNYTLGLLGTGNVTFRVIDRGNLDGSGISGQPYAGGSQVGFIIANPNGAVDAAALSPISLETLLRDSTTGTEVLTGDSVTTIAQSPNGVVGAKLLNLVGGTRQQAFLSFTTTKPFDAIQIREGSGIASVNNQLQIFAACVAAPATP